MDYFVVTSFGVDLPDQHANLLQPGNMQYTIVDDHVEEAPIYRYDDKVPQPTRPHENHGLAIEHSPTWPESQCKQQSKSFAVPIQGSLVKSPKIQGTQKCTLPLPQGSGLTLHTTSTKLWLYRTEDCITIADLSSYPFDVN